MTRACTCQPVYLNADRASVECDHDLLEPLPAISRRGIGQKLQAMGLDGLVACAPRKSPVLAERVSLWSVTTRGREMAESIDQRRNGAR